MMNAALIHEPEQLPDTLRRRLRDWAARPFEKACALLPEVYLGVENVYRGLKSDLATGGHLCHLERPNYEFGQYLARKVAM